MATPSKSVQRACRILRSKVRFERACFHDPATHRGDFAGDDAFTQKVREATRLYTESWVVPIIDAIERGDTNFLRSLGN